LEKEYENFENCSVEELIKHALKALSFSLAGDAELDSKSASVAVVGEDYKFEIIEGNAIQQYLDAIEVETTVEMDTDAPLEVPDL
jgi:20S proteasome subunit alpha 6